MAGQSQLAGDFGDIGSGLRLELQTVDIASNRADKLQPDFVTAVPILGQISPIQQSRGNAVHGAFVHVQAFRDFSDPQSAAFLGENLNDVQRAIHRLYIVIRFHK